MTVPDMQINAYSFNFLIARNSAAIIGNIYAAIEYFYPAIIIIASEV